MYGPYCERESVYGPYCERVCMGRIVRESVCVGRIVERVCVWAVLWREWECVHGSYCRESVSTMGILCAWVYL